MGRVRPRAVFLDRDGTLNVKAREHEYITSEDDFVWLAGAREGIARLAAAGYVLAVVSNQRGVARGLVTVEVLSGIEARIQRDLAPLGCAIAAFSYCPHDHAARCDCRKPEPGLITRLAGELEVDLARSWMIGDSDSDMVAGRRAGCRTALVGNQPTTAPPDLVAASLAEASELLIAAGPQCPPALPSPVSNSEIRA